MYMLAFHPIAPTVLLDRNSAFRTVLGLIMKTKPVVWCTFVFFASQCTFWSKRWSSEWNFCIIFLKYQVLNCKRKVCLAGCWKVKITTFEAKWIAAVQTLDSEVQLLLHFDEIMLTSPCEHLTEMPLHNFSTIRSRTPFQVLIEQQEWVEQLLAIDGLQVCDKIARHFYKPEDQLRWVAW